MTPIEIAEKLCTLCQVCVKKCPFDALSMQDGKIVVNEKCTACGICVRSCPEKAMSLRNLPKKAIAKDLKDYKGVWVFIEHSDCKIASVSFELLGEGRKLADKLGVELSAVLLGDATERMAAESASYGADTVLVMNDPLLKNYRTQPYLAGIVQLVQKYKPEIFLFGATTMGRDLAGAVATKLRTGLTADCTALDIEEQTKFLKQTRPAFGGNIMATILTKNHRPQMATVRPRVMKAPLKDAGKKAAIINETIVVSAELLPTMIVDFILQAEQNAPLEDAQIIVSGGKGMGSAKNFDMLHAFASAIGGTVAGSRKASEAGWISAAMQVGQTGHTVRPRIYFACGISGAIQHVVGMQTSDIIIAINKDPHAPIFSVANYGIVGDVLNIIPQMMKIFNEGSGNNESH